MDIVLHVCVYVCMCMWGGDWTNFKKSLKIFLPSPGLWVSHTYATMSEERKGMEGFLKWENMIWCMPVQPRSMPPFLFLKLPLLTDIMSLLPTYWPVEASELLLCMLLPISGYGPEVWLSCHCKGTCAIGTIALAVKAPLGLGPKFV